MKAKIIFGTILYYVTLVCTLIVLILPWIVWTAKDLFYLYVLPYLVNERTARKKLYARRVSRHTDCVIMLDLLAMVGNTLTGVDYYEFMAAGLNAMSPVEDEIERYEYECRSSDD